MIAALRDGTALPLPPASAVATDVRQRMRSLRSLVPLGLWLLIIIVGCFAVFGALASRELPVMLVLGLIVVALVVSATVFSRCDWRSVRGQVASELEALEAIEAVAGEALRHGNTRLEEQQAGSQLWVELAPENRHLCSVSLEVDTGAVRLCAGDRDCALGAFKRGDADHLRQLRGHLDAMVSAWPSTRPAARSLAGHDDDRT